MSDILVEKRNGSKEKLQIEKIHKVTEWACKNLSNVSSSELEMKSQIQFQNGMTTSDIQEILIKAAADLITEDTPNYQYVAGRLVAFHLRKQVYDQYTPFPLYDHINSVIDKGYYDPALLEYYTEEEWNIIDSFIDHRKDEELTYVAMEQFRSKYLVKNRLSKQIYETPQMAYILIAAVFFKNYPKETRLQYVQEYYDLISNHILTLPTPIMAGVRTPKKQYSSCTLIDVGDDLKSIIASTGAVVQYISNRAGIGLNVGRIRAEGSLIRNGDAIHTGLIPYIKLFQAATKSASQGGIRGGSSTLNFPIWRLDIEDLLVLKNNKGTEENRARHVDYCVQLNGLMYERLIQGGKITLFSPNDVPGLYEAFFQDQNLFKVLYEKAEKNTHIRKKTIKAVKLFSMLMTERKETARIYLMNVDHANQHSGVDESISPIFMTNLCVEVMEPTKPIYDMNDSENEVALCILSGLNFGKIKTPEDLKKPCEFAVRALNQLIDQQDYLLTSSKNSAINRRMLGIGIVNLAYWLAKNDISYQNVTEENLNKFHEYMEAFSYYLIKASVNVAKETNPCPKFNETKYFKGILPIDTYKKSVDELIPNFELKMDWETLRKEIEIYGMANSLLMAQFPSETSSQIANATNGVEPARSLVSSKQSKDGVLSQVVPEIKKLKNKYDLLWDQKSPKGYLKICAVMQKFMDQSISVNTSYNPKFFPNEEIPMSVMLEDLIFAYKYGLKSLYYFNTFVEEEKVEIEETCDSCKL